MDLEQSIAQHDKQIGQILTILSTTVDRQQRLDDALVDLAEAQERLTEAQERLTVAQEGAAASVRELAAAQKETRETVEEFRESLKQIGAETDRRIQNLVSAIGEMMRRQN